MDLDNHTMMTLFKKGIVVSNTCELAIGIGDDVTDCHLVWGDFGTNVVYESAHLYRKGLNTAIAALLRNAVCHWKIQTSPAILFHSKCAQQLRPSGIHHS